MIRSNFNRHIFTAFILFLMISASEILFADVSFDIGTELISTNFNGWIGLNWIGSHYFSDKLSLFADASLKTSYAPFTQTFEAISAGDTSLSYRDAPFFIRWGVSGYYDYTGLDNQHSSTEGIISPLWQIDTNVLFSYGTYKFSLYTEPEAILKQETDISASLGIKTGVVYAVTEGLLLKPSISVSVPVINTAEYSTVVKSMLDLSWYFKVPISFESKISYELNFPSNKNNFTLTWVPQISMLLARSITASLRPKVEYSTYQTYNMDSTDTVSTDNALSWYDPSFELLPAVLLDFNLSHSITLHSETDLDWIHYFQSNTDNFTASLLLDIEIEF